MITWFKPVSMTWRARCETLVTVVLARDDEVKLVL
jgi:hypothetical protein